jgi:hypothetical protein
MRTYLTSLLFLVAAACSSNSAKTANPDGGGGPTDGGPGPGSGVACGGLAGAHCEATEFCDYTANTCGAADGAGSCKTRPTVCPLDETPAIAGQAYCGCDGKVYAGECAANLAGTDINANGGCLVEPNRFACGFLQCDLTSQYCVHNPQAASPDQAYACVALPQACGNPATCGCLSAVQCGDHCAGDGKAGLTLTCP